METFDAYQEYTDETAVYPRVYTEDQVRNMLLHAYSRGFNAESIASVNEWVESDLDYHETSFNRLVYPVLGLVGEAGEIANKIKKGARDNAGQMAYPTEDEIADETGDVLWYVARIARELKVALGDIAAFNLDKLFSRKERGVIGGSGDNR